MVRVKNAATDRNAAFQLVDNDHDDYDNDDKDDHDESTYSSA